jgi:hypothetical protein
MADEGVLVLYRCGRRGGQYGMTGQADEQAQQTQLLHECSSQKAQAAVNTRRSAKIWGATIVVWVLLRKMQHTSYCFFAGHLLAHWLDAIQ